MSFTAFFTSIGLDLLESRLADEEEVGMNNLQGVIF